MGIADWIVVLVVDWEMLGDDTLVVDNEVEEELLELNDGLGVDEGELLEPCSAADELDVLNPGELEEVELMELEGVLELLVLELLEPEVIAKEELDGDDDVNKENGSDEDEADDNPDVDVEGERLLLEFELPELEDMMNEELADDVGDAELVVNPESEAEELELNKGVALLLELELSELPGLEEMVAEELADADGDVEELLVDPMDEAEDEFEVDK